MGFSFRPLMFAFAAALALPLVPATGFAQVSRENCTTMQERHHECVRPNKAAKPAADAAPASQYPHATRHEPEHGKIDKREAKQLNEGVSAANSGDNTAALKALQPIADSSDNAYVKALALVGLARIKFNAGDTRGAIDLQKRALALNSLDNDAYFQSLVALAQMQIADEEYAGALSTLDTFNTQSGAQSADAYTLQGNAYYRLQKYPEAIAAIEKARSLSDHAQASWDQIEIGSYFKLHDFDAAAKIAEAALARDPGNSAVLQNLITIYTNAGDNKKAFALLERARAQGQINDATGYLNLARMYYNLGLLSDDRKPNALKAVAVIQEGLDKGVLKPGYDSNKLLGDAYAAAKDYRSAASAYGAAAPLTSNGEVYFLRGQALDKLGNHKDARDALRKAVARGGFKRMGAAYLTLGNVELALKDRAAAIAAYHKAAQDPETRAGAHRMLKQLGQK